MGTQVAERLLALHGNSHHGNVTLPIQEEMEHWTQGKHFILVLDDLQKVREKDKEVAEMFTVGFHHLNFSSIYLCHNIFGKGCLTQLVNLNSHYITLFQINRDVM